jgi:periplasmic protein TonB
LKFVHAIYLSVALHSAAMVAVYFSRAHGETGGVAAPPVTSLQARVMTYQKSPTVDTVVLNAPAAQPTLPTPIATPALAAVAPAVEQAAPKPSVVLSNTNADVKFTVPAAAQSASAPRPVDATPKPMPTSAPLTPSVPASSATVADKGETIKDSASLEASPKLLSNVVLEYPLSAKDREGVVTLALTLGLDGKVQEVSVVSATVPGFFEEAAITGFKNAQFTPSFFQGLGVKVRMVVEVEFMPINRGGSVAGPK